MPVMTAATTMYSSVQTHKRHENADRHVALRVAGLFRVRGDGIEADEGEEDDRRAQHDARRSRRA